ncbi:hypothetical protein [Thermococcus radiotolerans]|nr:hypothetical protein [Thermococcus radiotolerans]
MPLERTIPSKDELREMVLSWQINEAVELALRDSDVLLMLLDLIGHGDENTKVRALLALGEVLKKGDDRTKFLVMNNGFGTILSALESKDPRLVTKSLKALSALVDGFPLRKDEFLCLVDVLVKLIKDPGMEFASIEMNDLVTKLAVSHPSPAVRSKVSWLVSHENPRLRAMGLRLLLNIFVFTGDAKSLLTLLEEASDLLLSEDDALLVDFVLDVLSEALRAEVPEEAIKTLPKVLSRVKRVAVQSGDFLIRSKAKKLQGRIEEILASHYRSRPEEAKNVLHRLVLDGEYSMAMDLAISLGDGFLLRWLSKTLELEGIEEFTPRFQVVGGPSGGSAAVLEFSPPAPSSGSVEVEETPSEEVADVPELPPIEKLVDDGDASALAKVLRTRPESVSELESFLRSRDAERRSNTLWVLSKLVSRLNNGELKALHPLIPALFEIVESGNPWERSKAAKILAFLASRGGRRDVLDSVLSFLEERPLPALEFFGYYFIYTWDEEAVSRVLQFLKDALTDPQLQFPALMVLDAITMWGIRPEIDRTVFEPILLKLLESDDEEVRKVTARVMERFKTA